MLDLNYYAGECAKELQAIGVKYGVIDELVVNTRAKKRWGQCKKLPNGHFSINISQYLLDERNGNVIGLKETILHEMCHTVEGCMNHKEPWNKVVKQVNDAYGYHIKRVDSNADKCLNDEVIKEKKEAIKKQKNNSVTYCLKCEKCGYTWYYHRKSYAVKHPWDCTHTKDGGRLIRVY